jgi:mitochondrial import inner membrane translocase subunit TIM50
LQPENCVQIKPWKLETDDTQLVDLIPFLECKCLMVILHLVTNKVKMLTKLTHSTVVAIARPSDTRKVLASYQRCDVAKEFLERSKEHQR